MRWQVGVVAIAGCSFRLPPGDGAAADSEDIAAWTARRPITIANAGLAEPLADFPVLITLDAAFDYGEAAAGGADLRVFAADATTPLAFDIDTFAPGATSWIWVRVPAIAAPPAPPTQIWLYYGNPRATSGANPAGVWSDQISVHHMSSPADATASGHDLAQPTAAKLPVDAAGAIGRAYAFDGSDDAFVIGGEGDYDVKTGLTVSLWLRAPAFTVDYQCMVCKGDNAWRMHRGNGSQHADFGTTNAAFANQNLDSGSNVSGGDWHHVVGTFDGVTKRIYVDGDPDGMTGYAQTLNVTDFAVAIGENEEASSRRNWNGDLDEIRISAHGRTGDWIGMEYRVVTQPAQTVAVGAREAVP
jgi:biopolymer transport protein ExbB